MRLQSADLGQVRPVAVVHQQVGGPQASLFHTTAVLVDPDRLGLRWRLHIPDGCDVLLQSGLVALYRKEVVPPDRRQLVLPVALPQIKPLGGPQPRNPR